MRSLRFCVTTIFGREDRDEDDERDPVELIEAAEERRRNFFRSGVPGRALRAEGVIPDGDDILLVLEWSSGRG